MGRLAEVNLVKTIALYGWNVLERWPFLLLLAVIAVVLFFALQSERKRPKAAPQKGDGGLALILILLFGAAALVAWSYSLEPRLMPMFASVAGGLVACVVGIKAMATKARATTPEARRPMPWRLLSVFALYLCLIPVGGVLVAGAAYAAMHSRFESRSGVLRATLLAAGVAVLIWVLFGLWMRHPVFDGFM